MSNALNRLRDFFDDELLVNVGRRMGPTARAQGLAEPEREALLQIRSKVTARPVFVPAETTRKVTLLASDYAVRVFLAKALRRMALEAPGLSFDVQMLDASPRE